METRHFKKGDRVRVLRGLTYVKKGTLGVIDKGAACAIPLVDFGPGFDGHNGDGFSDKTKGTKLYVSDYYLELVEGEAAPPAPAKPEPAPISEDDLYYLLGAMITVFDHDQELVRGLSVLAKKLQQHLPVDSVLYLAPAATLPPQEPLP